MGEVGLKFVYPATARQTESFFIQGFAIIT
jgi:hypothetical protein